MDTNWDGQRPKSGYVKRAPKARKRGQIKPPRPGNVQGARWDVAAHALFRASVMLAAFTIAYLLIYALNHWLEHRFGLGFVPRKLLLGPSAVENVAVGSWFFLIEAFAIVLGIRLFDNSRHALAEYQNTATQLDSLRLLVFNLIEDISDRRYSFAVALDTTHEKSGRYETNLAVLDRCLHIKLTELGSKLAVDGVSTQAARPFVVRAASILNRMYQRCYWAAEEAIAAYRANEAGALESALDKIFAASDPWEMIPGREGELADNLVTLYEAVADAQSKLRRPKRDIFGLLTPR